MRRRDLPPLVPSARSTTWRLGDEEHDRADEALRAVRATVLQRDRYTCQYCGFRAERFQEIHHIDDNHANNDISNLVCICGFCHLNFHIGRAGLMGEAALIFCGEVSQEQISHLARAIYVAIGDGNTASRGAYALMSLFSSERHLEAKRLLGTGNPTVLGTALIKLTDDEDAFRLAALQPNIRLLPMGRKMVDGIDQFETIVKYWRSESGPYGRLPTRDWKRFAGNVFGPDFIKQIAAGGQEAGAP